MSLLTRLHTRLAELAPAPRPLLRSAHSGGPPGLGPASLAPATNAIDRLVKLNFEQAVTWSNGSHAVDVPQLRQDMELLHELATTVHQHRVAAHVAAEARYLEALKAVGVLNANLNEVRQSQQKAVAGQEYLAEQYCLLAHDQHRYENERQQLVRELHELESQHSIATTILSELAGGLVSFFTAGFYQRGSDEARQLAASLSNQISGKHEELAQRRSAIENATHAMQDLGHQATDCRQALQNHQRDLARWQDEVTQLLEQAAHLDKQQKTLAAGMVTAEGVATFMDNLCAELKDLPTLRLRQLLQELAQPQKYCAPTGQVVTCSFKDVLVAIAREAGQLLTSSSSATAAFTTAANN